MCRSRPCQRSTLKHEKKLSIHSEKLVDLTAKSMSNNITISGLPEEPFAEPSPPTHLIVIETMNKKWPLKLADVNNARLQSHLTIGNPREKVLYFLRFYMNFDM